MSSKSEIILVEKSEYNQLRNDLNEVAEITTRMGTDCSEFFEGEVGDNIKSILNQLMVKYWDLSVSIGTLQNNMVKLSTSIIAEEKRIEDKKQTAESSSLPSSSRSRSMPWEQ